MGYLYHTEVWFFFDLVGAEALPTFTAMFQLMLENANDSRAMISENALHSIFYHICVYPNSLHCINKQWKAKKTSSILDK